MNTGEVAKRLESVDPYTFVVVRFATGDGGFFELPIQRVDYMPMKDGRDAYLALVPFQNTPEQTLTRVEKSECPSAQNHPDKS